MQFVSKVSHQIVKFHLLLADIYFIPHAFANQLPAAKILAHHVDSHVVKTFAESTFKVLIHPLPPKPLIPRAAPVTLTLTMMNVLQCPGQNQNTLHPQQGGPIYLLSKVLIQFLRQVLNQVLSRLLTNVELRIHLSKMYSTSEFKPQAGSER